MKADKRAIRRLEKAQNRTPADSEILPPLADPTLNQS